MITFNRTSAIVVLMTVLTVSAFLFVQSPVAAQAAGDGATSGVTTAAKSGSNTENPYKGDAAAVEEGKALFTGTLGCYGCHGTEGGGGIGPNLRDADWIYGGDNASLFETLLHGRANGMPAFGEAATDEQLWKVIAFVQSLGQ